MSHHVIEYDCECSSCRGTGVFNGMAERDGYAVVCHTCKGTGKTHKRYEYDDFTGRKHRDGIHHVVESNPGIVLGGIEFDFGGQLYEDWEAGTPFPAGSEMRHFTCPAWWYQGVDYEKKPRWEECVGVGMFSQCPHFSRKVDCWARFDREQAGS